MKDFEVTMNEYLPLRDVVFYTLRRAILKGELEPGERLMEVALANKMGVTVRAPSDTLYIYPNGKMVIGPNMFTNTGRWIDYHPQKRKR